MRVTVPASSANLGAGFDAVAVAVTMSFVLDDTDGPGLAAVEATHPAAVAHRHAGGAGPLWWRSGIPPGRGLGFSGAARVAGALMARAAAEPDAGRARRAALAVAVELEGHPENAAASLEGGVVVAAGGETLRLGSRPDVELVVWWPDATTSTKASRGHLPDVVAFDDAVFNVGRAALLVAALVEGRLDLLATAVDDRLHTERRLAASPASAEVFGVLGELASRDESAVLARWLSGSGPTVAAFCIPGRGAEVVDRLSATGTARVLGIDEVGAVVE